MFSSLGMFDSREIWYVLAMGGHGNSQETH